MPEEKAALLVRKFFGNSIIESKKSRMAQTETIAEESSEPEVSTSSSLPVGASPNHVTRTQPLTAEQSATDPNPLPESQPEVLVDSFDSDELFRLCGASDFGSSRDALDMDDDDADDDASLSFRTTASTLQRYSSCSERSVRLSDIINRPDPPSAPTSAPSPVARATTCVNTSVLPPSQLPLGNFILKLHWLIYLDTCGTGSAACCRRPPEEAFGNFFQDSAHRRHRRHLLPLFHFHFRFRFRTAKRQPELVPADTSAAGQTFRPLQAHPHLLHH